MPSNILKGENCPLGYSLFHGAAMCSQTKSYLSQKLAFQNSFTFMMPKLYVLRGSKYVLMEEKQKIKLIEK